MVWKYEYADFREKRVLTEGKHTNKHDGFMLNRPWKKYKILTLTGKDQSDDGSRQESSKKTDGEFV